MQSSKLNVLITRPEKSGRALATKLQKYDIQSYCQPLFDYQALTSSTATKRIIEANQEAIIIFVSPAAVEFANQAYSLTLWQKKHVFAVGQKTLAALEQLNIAAQVPEQQCSEGLLNHPQLTSVVNKEIIIVRGDSGREYLAEQLQTRGAKVHYVASYQKVWRSFTSEIVQQWQINEINCIVITSNAILERVLALIENSASYWQSSCLWIVASERIKNHAIKLGLSRVINANGAHDEAIITAIRENGISHDR